MLKLDLQRFAGEKTERATPQRRREARQEGQVARSADLTSAVALLAGIVLLRMTGLRFWDGWMNLMAHSFSTAGQHDLTKQGAVLQLLQQNLLLFGELLAPLLATIMIAAAGVGFAQVGPMFLPNLIMPKFSRINPLEGFKRLWSMKALVEAGKSLLKLVIVGAIVYHATVGVIGRVAQLTQANVKSIPGMVGQIVFNVAIQVSILFVFLAFLDYLFQRFEFEKNIRMSKEDIKQEFRNQEGDPLIRSKRRQLARTLAMRRMMQDVPNADVVVTNPTHFAVALRYEASVMAAPQVLAKGQDELAGRIREVAKSAGIPMVENVPLAQALYRQVDIGNAVPSDLFRAVAEVLAAVYRLRDEKQRR